jgi:1-deoxy-D-xylulose 5-phosphate reductoisomerase
VGLFLARRIAFGRIVPLIEAAMDRFAGDGASEPGLDELVQLDRDVREWSLAETGLPA